LRAPPPNGYVERQKGKHVSTEEPSYTITKSELETFIEIRKTMAYLVNETSEGRHHKFWLHEFDRVLNRLVGFEVYDVPEEKDDSES
jgi:hypothetical protein